MLVQGVATQVELEIANPGRLGRHVRIREGLHRALANRPRRTSTKIDAGGRYRWRLTASPVRRGEHRLLPVTVRVLGPWGLAWAQRVACCDDSIRVYPRIRWGGRVGRLLRQAHRHQLGAIETTLAGHGSEPYALRDYRRGDSIRSIHWRASARHGHLVVREEAIERSDRLVVLLDCGRAMASGAAGQTKLDHALAAALAVLRVAVGRGERVSLAAFSDRIECVARVRAYGDVPHAYALLYDLEARRAEPSFDLAVEQAEALERRRSTVLLVTSAVDIGAVSMLREALRRLASRHRTILVNLEDPELRRLRLEAPDDPAGAFAMAAALAIAAENQRLTRELRRVGTVVVSTSSDRLAADTLDAYLAAMGGRRRTRPRRTA
jgi:uncharacterized protein (DUF58 family)